MNRENFIDTALDLECTLSLDKNGHLVAKRRWDHMISIKATYIILDHRAHFALRINMGTTQIIPAKKFKLKLYIDECDQLSTQIAIELRRKKVDSIKPTTYIP